MEGVYACALSVYRFQGWLAWLWHWSHTTTLAGSNPLIKPLLRVPFHFFLSCLYTAKLYTLRLAVLSLFDFSCSAVYLLSFLLFLSFFFCRLLTRTCRTNRETFSYLETPRGYVISLWSVKNFCTFGIYFCPKLKELGIRFLVLGNKIVSRCVLDTISQGWTDTMMS